MKTDNVAQDPLDRLNFRWRTRLPIIRQAETAECGLACLAMISCYYGNNIDLPSLRQRFSLTLKGITLRKLIELAELIGLSSRPVRLDMDGLSQLQMPCILHWDFDHFVVLRRVTKGSVTIHDPALGIRKLSLPEASKHFTGVALELFKGPTFQPKKANPPVSLRALAGSIQGLTRALATVVSLALVLELFALLAPQFMQIVVDQVLADGDHDLLTLVGVSFAILLVFQTAVGLMRTWTVTWLGSAFSLQWAGNVFAHLMRLPQQYFIKRHLGDIVSRFGAMDTIQRTITTQFVGVILDGIMGTLTLVVMFAYSPLLAGLTGIALLVYAGLRTLYYRIYHEANLRQIEVAAKQQSYFMESVRGVQTVRLHNQGPTHAARYLNATAETINTSIGVQRLNLLFDALSTLMSGSQRIAVLWIGAALALKGRFTAGMLMAFVAYADQFTSRTASLVDYLIQLRLMRLQGDRLADIVFAPAEEFTEGVYVGPEPLASIEFDRVSFRYGDTENWVLKNCSFVVENGECLAITGPSGCGKSTLVSLILGLLDPQEGSIRIGGVDIRRLGKRTYRNMIGSVLQNDHLFTGSIAENISFFDDNAASTAIQRAAEFSELHSDIAAMPMAYNTLIGDMGSSLSGGQQQRLLLARALYRMPQILILDEATSHLDIECEKKIGDRLNALSMTRIIIAHRPETLRRADRLLILNNGLMAEEAIEVRT